MVSRNRGPCDLMHDRIASELADPHRTPSALLWGSFSLFAVLAVASLWLAGPQVEADEGSYLLSAAVLAGFVDSNPGSGYYSGYSLLLLPAFILQSQPDRIYHLALLVNAALVASTPFALCRMTRLLWPDKSPDVHATAALAASSFAPVLVLSQHTMSESALVPLYAFLIASAASLVYRHSTRSGIGMGAIAGFLFLVHPRGATMAAPVLLAVTAFALVRQRYIRLVGLSWLVALSVASLHFPLEQLAGRASGGSAYSVHTMLTPLTTASGWGWLVANLVGATTEAIVVTFGLPVVAGLLIGRELRRSKRSGRLLQDPRLSILIATVVSFIAALLVTAVFFIPPVRADMLSYGRYAMPTLVPLLAIGVLGLQERSSHRGRDITVTLGCGALGIACTAFAFRHLPAGAAENWNFVNSITLFLIQKHLPFSPWIAIAIVFVSGIALLMALLRQSARLASVCYAVANVAIFAIAWVTITLPGSRYYAHGRHVVEAASAFADVTGMPLCAELMSGIDGWHRPDLGWRLAPYLGKSGTTSCVPAAIQPVSDVPPPRMRLAAVERGSPLPGSGPIGLFIREGREFDEFSQARTVPPATAIAPLSTEDRQSAITIEFPKQPNLVVAVGEVLDVQLLVTNLGRATLSTGEDGLFPYPVRVGAHVRGATGELLNYRARLPESLGPGESAQVEIRIGPINHPGSYPLHAGIVQEHVAWFDGGVDTTLVVTR